MTNQEIFNKVKNHLMKQYKRCRSSDTHICTYRNENGESCAVGCLISDDTYTPDIEEVGIANLRSFLTGSLRSLDKIRRCSALKQVLDMNGVKEESYPLLEHLQKIHDERDIREWEHYLNIAADTFGLSY